MYELNCEKIRNSDIPISFDLEGKIDEDELLFRFTLVYDLQNIYLQNFVDSDNVLITNTLFSVENHLNNYFMVSRKAKNVENLKASYTYLTYTNQISPLYAAILHSLFQYILRIDNLVESVKNIADDKIFSLVSKAKTSLTSISITLIHSLSSLRIPTNQDFINLPIKKEFEDEMIEIFRSLEDVVEIYLKNKNKGSSEEIIIKRTDVLEYINNVLIQDDLLKKCFENYDKLLTDINIIYEFVNDSVNQKTMADLELIPDDTVTNLNKFIKRYRSLLLEYQEIMEKTNFDNIFRHCFPKTSSEIDLSIKKLENFYVDKLILVGLDTLLSYYVIDIRDFLIFSQTNYFAHIFSLRIISNLELIRNIYLIYDTSNENIGEITVENLSNKLILCDRITNAEKNWICMLEDDESGLIKSFSDLLKEEELHMSILEQKTINDPNQSSITDEDQLTDTNVIEKNPSNL
jgi:glycine cleavage system regulatory protein